MCEFQTKIKREVMTRFDGGMITSNVGGLLLYQTEHKAKTSSESHDNIVTVLNISSLHA